MSANGEETDAALVDFSLDDLGSALPSSEPEGSPVPAERSLDSVVGRPSPLTAEAPHDWFSYWPKGLEISKSELPIGSRVRVAVNHRPSLVSYVHDRLDDLKSQTIKNSDFYDNTQTNFICHSFHFGESRQNTLPDRHFIFDDKGQFYYAGSGEGERIDIENWGEACDLGFSIEKLVLGSLYHLYPIFGLNISTFADFLMHFREHDLPSEAEMGRQVLKAARLEHALAPEFRVTRPVAYELLNLTGPPLVLNFHSYNKMLKDTAESSIASFLDGFRYLPGGDAAIVDAWYMILKFFEYKLTCVAAETAFDSRDAFSTVTMSTVAYITARIHLREELSNLPVKVTNAGNNLGALINRHIHLFPAIMKDLLCRSRFDVVVEKIVHRFNFGFSSAYTDAHICDQQKALAIDISVSMRLFSENLGNFATQMDSTDHTVAMRFFYRKFVDVIRNAANSGKQGTPIDDTISSEFSKAIREADDAEEELPPGAMPLKLLVLVEKRHTEKVLSLLFNALGRLRFLALAIDDKDSRSERILNEPSSSNFKTETVVVTTKLKDTISFLRDILIFDGLAKRAQEGVISYTELCQRNNYGTPLFKGMIRKTLYHEGLEPKGRSCPTEAAWAGIDTLMASLGTCRRVALEEYNSIVRRAHAAGINPIGGSDTVSPLRQTSARASENIIIGSAVSMNRGVMFSHVYTITSSHKEYKHGSKLTDTLMNAPNNFQVAISDLEILKSIVTGPEIPQKSKKESREFKNRKLPNLTDTILKTRS